MEKPTPFGAVIIWKLSMKLRKQMLLHKQIKGFGNFLPLSYFENKVKADGIYSEIITEIKWT